MKTFEEKWTAWIDGELRGAELAEFEASLPDKAAAEAEKRDAQKLGTFLKRKCVFSMGTRSIQSSLRERLRNDEPAARERGRGSAWWPINGWSGLGDGAGDFFRLHVFRHARKSAGRSIPISHSDSEGAGRSRGEPERDDLDVRNEGGQGDRSLGGRVAVAPVGVRAEIILRCKGAPFSCSAFSS